jgi:FlaA1/EpsC-like NDP-sugar epimerase
MMAKNNVITTKEFVNSSIAEVIGRTESMFQKDIAVNYNELQAQIKDKSVLVIGGAGTIGSCFIKELIQFYPKKLVVVDTNENGLTELTRSLRSSSDLKVPEIYLTYPLDFGNVIFERLFKAEGPFDIVANFAAHKHVRSEKDVYSIAAMIENNVLKADFLLKLLKENNPKHFFCVSTDKAANPVNVMGATKKLMEELIMAYSEDFKVTTARFANVAFSNGSLLDGFIHRVSQGHPLSCPSDVKRFFVTPSESGQICLMACILGKSGEVFFPRLEESDLINFRRFAEVFLHQLGYGLNICLTEEDAKIASKKSLENNYPVYFFESDTSGEKLYEEFFTETDELELTRFQGLGVITNAKKSEIEEIEAVVNRIKELFFLEQISKADIVSTLKQILPDFDHNETGKSLDQKM